MPFRSIAELPADVRRRLSAKGQRAFMGAFNSAFDGTCKDRSDREGCAFAVGNAAANRAEKAMRQASTDAGGTVFKRAVRIVKLDEERQIAYMPVLLPNVEDAQGDVIEPLDVELAAHTFAKEYASGRAELGLDHEITLERDRAMIVETWVEKSDIKYGDEEIPAGTWMIGVHASDDEVWKSLKDGDRSGASIEGVGIQVPL